LLDEISQENDEAQRDLFIGGHQTGSMETTSTPQEEPPLQVWRTVVIKPYVQ
jgi:hypothetical protein